MVKFIYFADVLNALSTGLTIVLVLLIMYTIFTFIMYMAYGTDIEKAKEKEKTHYAGYYDDSIPPTHGVKYAKGFRKSLIVTILLFIILAFTPKKETLYLMAAGQVVETAVKSEEFTGLTKKSYMVLDKWLDKKLEDTDLTHSAETKKSE